MDSQLESTLRWHAVNAGLLDAAQPFTGAAADLAMSVAAMCAEICELGGNRTAMFAAVDEETCDLSDAEAHYAAFIAEKCAAIARGHRFDKGAGAAIRAAFAATPKLFSRRMRLRAEQPAIYAVV